MDIKIYDTLVPMRTHYCKFLNHELSKVDDPYILVYVRFKGCNANCSFCEYMDDANSFDIDKYTEILKYLVDNVKIRKLNLTGGEPTLNYDKFEKIFHITNDILSKDTEMVVNTNGIFLDRIVNDDDMSKRFTNISLSRHHYDDDKNDEIFKTKTPTMGEIKSLQEKMENKDVLNFTCNLIKDNIDKKGEVYKFLDVASSAGIKVVGFVSLMPINEFCNNNFINFNKLGLKGERFSMTKQFRYQDVCTCNNYVYFPEDDVEKYVRVYYKNTYKPDLSPMVLSFDGKYLRKRFDGDIIK